MKKLLLLIISALLISGCATTPQANSLFSSEDLNFAEEMIPHHEQAIEMADIALGKSTNPEILALANEIKAAQGPEIEQMKSWGSSKSGSHAGHMMDEGMLTDDEMAQLKGASGAEFDRLFLEGMIKHHQGAIQMADMVIDSANEEAALLGKAIVESQSAEIERMRKLLTR
jgi:uncharacterized protein (DUF305 family)